MKWPTLSPDMNPLENIWGIFSNKVKQGGRQFERLADLKCAIISAWKVISQSDLQNLLNSMPNGIEELLKNFGGHTYY